MMSRPQSSDRVYGIHGATSVLKESPQRVRRVLIADGFHGKRLQAIRTLAKEQRVAVKSVPRSTLNRITDGAPHQGVVLDVDSIVAKTESELQEVFATWQTPLILGLDGVVDPRNVGACLRTAEGAGVDAVLLGRSRSAPLTDTVYRTSMGALESMFVVHVANLARRLDWLKNQGCWIIGSDHSASTSYSDVDLTVPTVIVTGGEEKGLRALTASKCDQIVGIPMLGQIESLNVAVATGVLLYEAIRQRAQAHQNKEQDTKRRNT
ncbi:MAG: 23S rRNA (guanosine(2251)-2'-O)-methyltransferase RlmB [Gammaproteobacteria bacterium]|nr:23S rRNA (guanosine(2251)-2'-O)-methyltransferase RlmB [Gammaproteobacteria bacterium]